MLKGNVKTVLKVVIGMSRIRTSKLAEQTGSL